MLAHLFSSRIRKLGNGHLLGWHTDSLLSTPLDEDDDDPLLIASSNWIRSHVCHEAF